MTNSRWYALIAILVFILSNQAALLHKPELDAWMTVLACGYSLAAIIYSVKES